MPRVKMVRDTAKSLGRAIDTVHLGTCMKAAMKTAACPIRFDDLKAAAREKFGVDVVLGTHAY